MMTATSATRILCFGDSNTWGQMPEKKGRYAADERWTALLQRALGDAFDVIEEGLGSRTTDLDYSRKPGRNGKTYLVPCLQSQSPLDGVILMLGTNDLKIEYDRSAVDIADAVRGLIDDIRAFARDGQGSAPKILLLSPAPINPRAAHFKELYTAYYNDRSATVSGQLATELAKVAADTGCSFIDIAPIAATGVDGVHLTPEAHKHVAAAIAPIVKEWAS
jgi:lysophospholipase L1-like esterase